MEQGLRQGGGSGNTTFVGIVGGKFAQRVKQGTPNAVERFSEKAQKNLYEVYYKELVGTIKQMEIEDGEYGKQFKVLFDCNGADVSLQMPVDSRYFSSFCSKYPNIPIGKVIKIVPFNFMPRDRDKPLSGVNFFYDCFVDEKGTKVEPFYTKDTPHDCPQPESQPEDSDDWKMYFMKVTKWQCKKVAQWNDELQNSSPEIDDAKRRLADKINASKNEQSQYIADDDLPF